MRKLAALSMMVAAATLFPCLASAQNFYAAIRGGPGLTPDGNVVPREFGRQLGDRPVEFKTGFTGGGAVGYAWPIGLRAEGEFGYIYAPVERESGISIAGSIKSYLMMANVYYDLRTAWLGPFKPYVGFGLGGARVNEDRQGLPIVSSVVLLGALTKVNVDEWRTAFAYQARIGVGYDVNTWLDLSAGYRYVHIDGGNRDRVAPGFTVHSEAMRNHSFELGAAFKF